MQKQGGYKDATTAPIAARSTPSIPRRTLVLLTTEGTLSRPLPEQGTLVLGRGREANVVLPYEGVSRLHCTLHIGSTLAIEDLGSRNGTHMSGRALQPNTQEPLDPFSFFEVGPVACFVREEHKEHTAANVPLYTNKPIVPTEAIVVVPAMQALYTQAALVARGDIHVLLLGETGAGKELLAEEVHRRSSRNKGPLVRINCAAFAENLLEDELFGHEKGAFTGANSARPGLIEAAHGGTLFLDEVGEMSAAMQARLLRVLESRTVRRIGSNKEVPVDVRVVSATHRELEAMAKEGSFRSDLYYRLGGVTLRIPPLRERTQEVLPLAERFLANAASRLQLPPPRISSAVVQLLEAYSWPGNLRELRNVIERALLLCSGGELLPEHLLLPTTKLVPARSAATNKTENTEEPLEAADEEVTEDDASTESLPAAMAEAEKARIIEALRKTNGNQTQAAKLLGIARRTLVKKLSRYNIPRPRK